MSDLEKNIAIPRTTAVGLRSTTSLASSISTNNGAIAVTHSVPFVAATLTVNNIRYTVTAKKEFSEGKKPSPFKKIPTVTKPLLSDISLKALPGRILAIMGPSGSGKTTLLDLIGDRQSRNKGKLQGAILLNDMPMKSYGTIRKRLVGYVTQEDDFIETLTVFETLLFAANLKLPRTFTTAQKTDRIEAVMLELGLTHIRDSKVGGAIVRGISGGEKRRVTIAIELLSSPSVLLLDEPTSGLSSTDALNVARAIKGLSAKGRTIVLTVHQPRSDIFELFDDLLLLSKGSTVYFGRASSAVGYFESMGHETPVGWNVADHLLDLITLHQDITMDNSTDFARTYTHYVKTNPQAYINTLSKVSGAEKESRGQAMLEQLRRAYTTEYAATTLTQTLLITKRNLTNLARHPVIFQASVVIHIIFALVIGSLFSGLHERPEMGPILFNKSIALFFITSFLATMTFSAMPQFIIERTLFIRERSSGMFRTTSYFFAKTLVETFAYTVLSVIFVVITYFLIGLKGSLIYYFVSVSVFVNVALSLIAAIGAGAENSEVGMNILSLVNTMSMLFSGFIVGRTEIPRGWIWMLWSSYYQWVFSGLLNNEFNDGSVQGLATLKYYGMDQVQWLSKWNAVYILLGYFVVFRCIGLMLLLAKKA